MVVALTMIVFLKICRTFFILYIGSGGIYRFVDIDWIYPFDVKEGSSIWPSLLVGGIMIGYICSAITDFVVTFADDSDIVNLHGWSQGSFSGMSWSNIRVQLSL